MNLHSVFYPKSIAVIGASRTPKTVGNDIVKNLITQGYDGLIHPINPHAEVLYGHKVYASTKDLNEQIDLIIVCVPAPAVAQVIEDAAKHNGAKAAIVISAGCKEIGNKELEQIVRDVCDRYQIAMIGPNCLGVINPEIRMNASFAGLMPKPGNVAFISQSGALCTSILDYASHLEIGFSKFLSIGNKAQTDERNLLEYFAQDEHTKVIGMYVEELQNAPAFIATAQQITRGKNAKPIIVLKSGRTAAGASAVASHTGALASDDAAYDTLFKQAGILRANTIRELLEYIDIFSQNDAVLVEHVAIITNAGGPGVLTTDEVIKHGLNLATLNTKTQSKLKAYLPKAASTKNPVDILGDARADRYQQALEIVAKDKNTDAIISLLTPQSMTETEATADAIIQVKHNTAKPIVASFMGQKSVTTSVLKMESAGVSTTAFPELAARGLAKMGDFYQWSQEVTSPALTYTDVDKRLVKTAFSGNQKQFPEAEALHILQAYNIPTLKTARASSGDEAVTKAEEMNVPLAMKIISPEILHKSDVGGVRLNVTASTIRSEYEEMIKTVKQHMPQARIEGVLLMEMASKTGVETIVGVKKDTNLGHMLMFGLGGIYVEILKDVQFAFTPLTEKDARRMIDDLKTAKLFEGVRGQQPLDTSAITEVLGRISQLVIDFPEIKELDINPLLVLPKGQGAICLDARIILEDK